MRARWSNGAIEGDGKRVVVGGQGRKSYLADTRARRYNSETERKRDDVGSERGKRVAGGWGKERGEYPADARARRMLRRDGERRNVTERKKERETERRSELHARAISRARQTHRAAGEIRQRGRDGSKSEGAKGSTWPMEGLRWNGRGGREGRCRRTIAVAPGPR